MITKIANNRILYHLLFWVIFIASFTLLLGGKYGYAESLKDVTLEATSYALIIYFNLLVLIPRLLFKRKYMAYVLSLMAALALVVPLHSLIEYYNFYSEEGLRDQVKIYRLGFLSLINVSFMVALTTGLKFGMEWFNQQQKGQELEKQRLQSELKFLKSQINPHFLFNTLNNLYSLTLKKSDLAPEMVLKLSEIMRYMLYDSNEREVPLEKEVNYIKNYIALEKLRQDDNTKINLEIDYTPNGQTVAPLLFVPFLENSFKHGVNNVDDGWVNVKLREQNKELTFCVENNKPDNPKTLNGNKGIGLKNVKRRLELIYPDRHELNILDDTNTYQTTLKLQLK